MKSLTLSNLLFSEDKNLLEMAHIYNNVIVYSLAIFLIIAVIIAYKTGDDPETIFTKAMLSILIMILADRYIVPSAKWSLAMADDVFKGIMHEDLVKKFVNGKLSTEDGWGELISNNLFIGANLGLTMVASLISVISIGICSIIYTLGVHFAVAFIGFPALLGILPNNGKMYLASFVTFLWIIVTPHVTGFIIFTLLGSVSDMAVTSGSVMNSVGFSAKILLMALLIGLSPLITYFLVSGKGVAAAMAAANFGLASKTMQIGKSIKNASGGGGAGRFLGQSLGMASYGKDQNGNPFKKSGFGLKSMFPMASAGMSGANAIRNGTTNTINSVGQKAGGSFQSFTGDGSGNSGFISKTRGGVRNNTSKNYPMAQVSKGEESLAKKDHLDLKKNYPQEYGLSRNNNNKHAHNGDMNIHKRRS